MLGDTNNSRDIFVHDRQTGATTRLSVGPGGTEAFRDSNSVTIFGIPTRPDISADGRYVAFESSANNLVTGDTNGEPDVFVHNRQTGTTTRSSVDSNGTQGNGFSFNPRLSADGRFVAFVSHASNLVHADINGVSDVFVHDRQTSQKTRVSVDSKCVEGGNHSGISPAISADGRFVAFESRACNLIIPNSCLSFGKTHVFLHDRQTGLTLRAREDSQGNQGNGSSQHPALSEDGRYVAFDSEATNLIGPGGTWGVYVYDRQTS